MNLIDMQLSADEAKSSPSATLLGAEESGGPKYPWGLTLCLDDSTLAKLGIDALPQVGQRMQLTAVVEVCSTSQHANQDGTEKSVSLQITKMGLEGEQPDPATVLYGR